ncbi:MAG TPA: TraM recognition domain-containing protein [Terracidiphilus sp.]|nr:TraM recognition domain-containing protein [Terracidiphilus sp.]
MVIGTSDRRAYEIDPTRHINILGGSGVGKTSLLEWVFVSWLKDGHGGAFFDPHGDAADRLPLLIPKDRWKDIIWYDPDADAVPPLNPLYFTDPEQLELAKETCLTILKALAGSDSAWGNATPYNIRNALDAITENSDIVSIPTLVHVFRFCVDADYRDKHLNASRNPFVKLYQKQLGKDDIFSPAINKLAKLMRPNIVNAIGNPQCLDLLDCMNQNKILICRFSKGRLGEETAQILYSLVVSMLSIAALKREQQTDRPPFMIVADEAQNAIHGGRFGTLLAEARKYGISLVTAFQGFYQVPFMRDVLTNSATQIVFNPSGEDAETMAKNWNWPNLDPAKLTDLSRYEFHARTFEGNTPVVRYVKAPLQLHTKTSPRTLKKILKTSLMKYSTPKKNVNESIAKFLSS